MTDTSCAVIAPRKPTTAIPKGRYTVQIIDSSIGRTYGNRAVLMFKFEVMRGAFAGRFFLLQLEICSENCDDRLRSQRHFSAICHITNNLHVTDSSQLHFQPMTIKTRAPAIEGDFVACDEIEGFGEALQTAPGLLALSEGGV